MIGAFLFSKEIKMKELKKLKLTEIVQDVNTRYYSKVEVTDLMASLQQEGLLQPIGVTKTDGGKYTVVYGNRRLTAMRKLGWLTCDAYVYEDMDWSDVLLMNMAENSQREDVTAFEEGHSIYTLIDTHGLTTRQISIRLGLPITRIKQSLQLFQDLPAKWRDKVVNVDNSKGKIATRLPKGQIAAGTAAKIVRTCKENNMSRAKLESMLKAVSTTNITMPQAQRAVQMMATNTGLNTKEAISVAKEALIVRVAVPIAKTQIEKYKSTREFSREALKVLRKHMGIKKI